jgi:hypothetical protein
VAAGSGAAITVSERTVAVGPAAPAGTPPTTPADTPPTAPASPSAPAPRRRRLLLAGAGLAALVAAIAVVVAVLATGGSGSPSVSTLSLTPVQSQFVPAIPHRRLVQQVALKARAGYEYRLSLETEDAPPGSTARTRLPLYMTLMARRGSMPFVTVQRLKLPSIWPWTRSSIVASFTLDPNPDGSGQVGLSWYAVAGDKTDVTHYLDVGPQGIRLD